MPAKCIVQTAPTRIYNSRQRKILTVTRARIEWRGPYGTHTSGHWYDLERARELARLCAHDSLFVEEPFPEE